MARNFVNGSEARCRHCGRDIVWNAKQEAWMAGKSVNCTGETISKDRKGPHAPRGADYSRLAGKVTTKATAKKAAPAKRNGNGNGSAKNGAAKKAAPRKAAAKPKAESSSGRAARSNGNAAKAAAKKRIDERAAARRAKNEELRKRFGKNAA